MIEVGGVPIELGRPFEFWGLCAGLLVAYFWALRTHGRVFHPNEPAATGRQKFAFVSGVVALLLVSGTPWHDIGEQGLYFFHVTEHIVQAFVVAPLLLVGTPEWMFRMLLRHRAVEWIVTRLGRPLVAGLLFNAAFALLHWPAIVDRMLEATAVHGVIHVLWLTASLIMWLPVVSPAKGLVRQLTPPAQMGYLLTMTLLPTVPSSFLTFGESPLYRVYEGFPRMWEIPALEDMQIAGLVMKIGGGFLLWGIITVKFFRWAATENRRELDHRRGGSAGTDPDDGPGGGSPPAPRTPDPSPSERPTPIPG